MSTGNEAMRREADVYERLGVYNSISSRIAVPKQEVADVGRAIREVAWHATKSSMTTDYVRSRAQTVDVDLSTRRVARIMQAFEDEGWLEPANRGGRTNAHSHRWEVLIDE